MNSAKEKQWISIFKMNQENTETFRCEKGTWNIDVSSTREFWNFGFKTKSWNF